MDSGKLEYKWKVEHQNSDEIIFRTDGKPLAALYYNKYGEAYQESEFKKIMLYLRNRLKTWSEPSQTLMDQNQVLQSKLAVAVEALEFVKKKTHSDSLLIEELNTRAARVYECVDKALNTIRGEDG